MNCSVNPIKLLLLLFGLASAQFLPNGCPEDFSVHLLLPHESDCQSYYSCSNGRKILMQCGAGTLFDVDLQGCNHAHAVDCQIQETTTEFVETTTTPIISTTTPTISTTTPTISTTTFPPSTTTTTPQTTSTTENVEEFLPNGCPADFSIHLLLPHETDCGKFYSCSNGRRILMRCPSTLFFNLKSQTCDWPQNVDCNIQTTTEPTTDGTNTETTYEFTTTTLNELEEEIIANTTTTTAVVDKITTLALVTDGPVTASTTSESLETTTDLPSTPSICPDGFFGVIPHPELCDSYYTCTGWSPIQLFCRPGQEFDPEQEKCVEISEGGCTWSQNPVTNELTSTEATTENNTSSESTTVVPEVTEDLTTDKASIDETTQDATTPKPLTTTEKVLTEFPTTAEVTTDQSTVLEEETTKPTDELTTFEPTTDNLSTFTITSKLPVTTTETVFTTAEETSSTYEATANSTDTTAHVTTEKISTDSPNTTDVTTDQTFVTEDEYFEPTTEKSITLDSSTTAQPEPVIVCPDGYFGNMSHPDRCDAYFLCSGWDPILLFCPSGNEFDPILSRCVIISEGGCNWQNNSTTTVTEQTTTPDMTTEAVTEEFSTTSDAITASWETTVPTDEPTFKTTTEELTTLETTTQNLTEASTIKTTTEKEESTHVETEGTTAQPTPVICPDGYFGSVPHPERCDAYFMCTGWDPILLFCPSGNEFDPVSGTCLVIAEGGCNWQKNVTTSTTERTTAYTSPNVSTDAVTEHFSTTPEAVTTSWETTTSISTNEQTTTTQELTTLEPTTTQNQTDAFTIETTTEKEESTQVETEGTTAQPPPIIVCPDGYFGNMSHPDRCDAYFLCSGWDPILLFCPSGNEFDPTLGRCVTISVGGCNWQKNGTTTVTEQTTSPDLSTDAVTDEFSTTSDAFTTSWETTIPTDEPTFKTTTQELTTLETITTQNQTDASTIETTTENEESTHVETEGTTAQPTPAICPDGYFGSVPHPERCDAYFMCTGWDPILLFCPSGNEFDPVSGTCLVIAEGGCNWQKNGTTSTTEHTTAYTSPDSSTDAVTEDFSTTPEAVTTSWETTTSISTDEQTSSIQEFTTLEPTTTQNQTDASTIETTTEKEESTQVETEGTTAQPTPIIVCPDGYFGNMSHPDRCDAYFLCSGWDPILLFCPSGNEFDPISGRCVTISVGGCNWQKNSTTAVTDQTTSPDLSTDSVTDDFSTTSDTFTTAWETTFTTATEELTTSESTTLNVTDDFTNSTQEVTTENLSTTTKSPTTSGTTSESSENSTTTEELTTERQSIPTTEFVTEEQETTVTLENTSEHTPTPTESTTVQPTPVICPDGYFGSVPHPERCDAYFMCTGWDPILLFCPSGNEFDPASGTCLVIAEGGCNWQKNGTTSTTERTTAYTSPNVSTDVVTEDFSTTPDAIPTESWETTTSSKSTDEQMFETTTEEITTLESTTFNVTETSTASSNDSTTENLATITESQTTLEPTNETESNTNEIDITEDLTTEHVTSTQTIVTEDQETTVTLEVTSEHTPILIETTTTQTTPVICPDGYFGSIAHPERCDAYFMCTGWDPILLFCPSGNEFDPAAGTCVMIAEGGCNWHKNNTTPVTEATTDAVTQNLTTTSDFVTQNGSTTESWETTSSFESTSEAVTQNLTTTSDFVTQNGSTTEFWETTTYTESTVPQTTLEVTTDEFITSKPTTLNVTEASTYEATTENYPTITESQTTQNATNESTETSTVNIDTTFEITTESTDLPATIHDTTTQSVVTEYEATTPTTPNTVETEGTTVQPTPVICPDGYFGSVAHPERCDAYFMCTGWDPILLFCPSGNEFDPEAGTCVVIAEGGCNWQKNSTTPVTEATTDAATQNLTTTSDFVTQNASTTESWETTSSFESTSDAVTQNLTTTSDFVTQNLTTTSHSVTQNQSTTEYWETTTPFESTDDAVTKNLTTTSDFVTQNGSTTESWQTTTSFDSTDEQTTEARIEFTTLESTTEANEATTPVICPDGFFGSVPNLEDCESYYMCTGWMPIPLRCPNGFEFDPNTQSCITKAEGGCSWLSTSTIQPSTEASSPQFTTAEIATDNQKTTTLTPEISAKTTTDEVSTIVSEVTSEFTDTTETATIPVDDVFVPPNPGRPVPPVPDETEATTLEATTETETTADLVSTTLEATTEKEETTTLDTSTTEQEVTEAAPICPDGFFGSVPHPDECDTYYMCSGWMPILLRCSAGFEFNPATQTCVAIENGGCTYNKASRTI